jgi:phosphohistidine swiveling domain-containing protein
MTEQSANSSVDFEDYKSRLDDELCTWPARPALFTRANALDQWPLPITPLTQDLVELPQERGLEAAFVSVLGVAAPSPEWTWNGCFYGYVMFGVSPAAGLADNLPGWDRAGVYADYLGVRQDPNAAAAESPRPSLASVLKIGTNFAFSLSGYQKEARRQTDAARAQLIRDQSTDYPALSDAALRDRIAGFPALHTRQRTPHAVASVIGAALFKQLVATVTKLAGDEDGAQLATDMISSLGGVHLSDAAHAMEAVAAGSISRAEFVAEYGFRGSNEFELAAHPWSEDPDTLDRLIDASARDRAPATVSRRDAARDRVKELAGWRWGLIRRQISLTETHLRWRENGKIPMAMGVASLRPVVREAARRLVERDRISDPSDIYFLRLAELLAELGTAGCTVDCSRAVARRRQTHELAYGLPLPEMLDARPGDVVAISDERWASLGLLAPPESDPTIAVLTGVPGAHGTSTGRARIVSDPTDVIVDEGDILVARGTDSAWTPLFMQADAIVVDIGGVMSHACIAAREIGIPCVIDVKVGTTRIAEGQKITVDGTAGTVTLL